MTPHSDAVRIQVNDFDLAQEQRALLGTPQGQAEAGAVVSFVGTVRGASSGQPLTGMTLEHYPGMTEASIEAMVADAHACFEILAVRVVHRVGHLPPGAQIVAVLVTARHRGDAFAACEFLMDYLKTQAPFWKKEHRADGDHWVEPRSQDEDAMARWASVSPRPASS
ncbi:MAG: molybdenum cofactor biosynthesis protein MoaE [Pseudomonadota bacterium]